VTVAKATRRFAAATEIEIVRTHLARSFWFDIAKWSIDALNPIVLAKRIC
jgi:hypothetical protein